MFPLLSFFPVPARFCTRLMVCPRAHRRWAVRGAGPGPGRGWVAGSVGNHRQEGRNEHKTSSAFQHCSFSASPLSLPSPRPSGLSRRARNACVCGRKSRWVWRREKKRRERTWSVECIATPPRQLGASERRNGLSITKKRKGRRKNEGGAGTHVAPHRRGHGHVRQATCSAHNSQASSEEARLLLDVRLLPLGELGELSRGDSEDGGEVRVCDEGLLLGEGDAGEGARGGAGGGLQKTNKKWKGKKSQARAGEKKK